MEKSTLNSGKSLKDEPIITAYRNISEAVKKVNEKRNLKLDEDRKSNFEEPMWKKAKDLTMNDYFGMIINTNEIIPEFNYTKKTEQIFIKLDKKEHWYMMGYFLGEVPFIAAHPEGVAVAIILISILPMNIETRCLSSACWAIRTLKRLSGHCLTPRSLKLH